MKIYGCKVFPLGADSPKTFYFESEEKANACYNAYERSDGIIVFDDNCFPAEMLSDWAF